MATTNSLSGSVLGAPSRVELAEGTVVAEFIRDPHRLSPSSARAASAVHSKRVPTCETTADANVDADETTRLIVRRHSSNADSRTHDGANVELPSHDPNLPADTSLNSYLNFIKNIYIPI